MNEKKDRFLFPAISNFFPNNKQLFPDIKKKCNKNILKMYKKVYTYNIKYHANVIF